MQKNAYAAHYPVRFSLFKFLLVMKMIAILLTVLCMQAAAIGYSQTTVTLSAKDLQLKEVFNSIQKQTGYSFLYHENEEINNIKVSVNVVKMPVKDVIERILDNTGFDYKITKNRLVIIQTEQKAVKAAIVTGIVSDSLGKPLEGVSVGIRGKPLGTVTNASGQFSINADPGDYLVISRVGMITQEIAVGNEKNFNITLLFEDARTEDDVVIVAYGKQKKATLTGSVATITTREIRQSPAANLAVALTGRLPGLIAQQRSGEPGRDETLLFMRGRGTVNGQAPLIMVDGVERELNSIDPNEVETVTILKDASATALYGVRGANGVILVTTKRGTETVPTISLNVESGRQTFTRWPTVLNSYDWAVLKNQAWKNDNPTPGVNDKPPYSDYALERFQKQDWPEAYPNNNWVDKLLNKWVAQTRYNLTLNGKGSNVGYFVNIGFLNQGGQFKVDPEPKSWDPANYMKRYNFRSNIDATLNRSNTLRTFLNASGYLERVNGPYVDGRFGSNASIIPEIIHRTLQLFPVTMPGPLTPGGEVLIGSGSYQQSPWAEINRTGYRRETRSNVTATWGLDQDWSKIITKGLTSKIMASFDTRSMHYLNGARQHQYWEQVIDPNLKGANGFDSVYYRRIRSDFDNTPISTSVSASFQSFFDVQFQNNYNRTFGAHTVGVLLLAQQQGMIRPSDPLPFNVRGLATRLSYSYDNRYMFEFNAGYNGSEQFSKGKRYGFFPSYSAAWNVANESFFQPLRSTVNLLKLRGSYGTVGNDQIGGTRFLYLDNVSRGGGGPIPGVAQNNGTINELFFGNPNVSWETAKKMNIGLDVGLFKSLEIVVDVFNEKRDNILIYRPSIPVLIGVPSSSIAPYNIGKIENKGWEIEATYNKSINKDLYIITKANIGYNDNKIIYIDELKLDSSYAYPYRSTGYSIGQQWGYQAEGFYKDQQDIDARGLTFGEGRAFRPGDLIYKDMNGDKIINNKDVVPLGYSNVPKLSWGWATSVNYKIFDVSFLFQGVSRVSGVIGGDGPWEWYDFRGYHQQAWTPERAAAGTEILYPALSLSVSPSNTTNSFFIQDRSFVRLKNIEVGVSLPYTWASKIAARKVRFYMNGLNLLTWDKQRIKDWDPELLDNTTYPILKIINFGLNVTF